MSFCQAVPRLTGQYRGRDEEAPDPLEPKVPETVHGASRLGAEGAGHIQSHSNRRFVGRRKTNNLSPWRPSLAFLGLPGIETERQVTLLLIRNRSRWRDHLELACVNVRTLNAMGTENVKKNHGGTSPAISPAISPAGSLKCG